MIALQHERARRLLVKPVGRASRARNFHIFVNNLAVVSHSNKARIFNFFPAGIESRRSEDNIEGLPLARRLAGVDRRRAALEIGFGFAATGIDSAAIAVFWLLHAPTVQNLNFITPLKIHAGIRVLWHDELDMGLDIAVLKFGNQIHGLALWIIDHHPRARLSNELLVVFWTERNRANYFPFTSRLSPGFQILAVEQNEVADSRRG